MRGSLLTWSALGQHTTPEQWVRADIETLLGPYRVPDAPRVAHPPRAFCRREEERRAKPRRRPSHRRVRTPS